MTTLRNSASTFVVKIATFAKPQNVMAHVKKTAYMKYLVLIIFLTIKLTVASGQDYKQLQKQLENISLDDQKHRSQSDSIRTLFGFDSEQYKELWKTQHYQDSINKIVVIEIIDKYGWIGHHEIGYAANYALFSVIMHSDIQTQEKYLPTIRTAVKEGKADGESLAMLEDRIALRHGKKQIYATQLRQDEKTKEYYLAPLEDPVNVDERRKAIGMKPLAEDYNLKVHGVTWNPKTYKPRE